MKERMNEQVMNKIYIYYVWILSEWVDEGPKIADGVNELVNNTVYSSYDAHDNPVHVYLCLFTSDWLAWSHSERIILCV